MRANCVICSDLFDEINPISAAPCGHVYHSSCLTLWIGQSKTCPHCRARIVQKDIQKLYFNFPPKNDLNSSELENEIVNLKAQLSAKNVEVAECKKQKEEILAFVRVAEEKASGLQQEVYEKNSEISKLRLKIKHHSKLEAQILNLEKMNVAMSNDLEKLNNVMTIVNGTQKDVEDILKEYNDHSEATKQLATYCTCLKRELIKVIESKDKLVELNSKLQRENGRFAAKVKFFEEAMAISSANSNKRLEGKNTPVRKASPFNLKENSLLCTDTPSTSTQSNSCEEVNMSPLAVAFNKKKFNMCIKTSTTDFKFDSDGQSLNVKSSNMASLSVNKQNDNNTIVRIGYNGLGGHSNFIATSGIKKIKTVKKKN